MSRSRKEDKVAGVQAPYKRILLNFPPDLAAQLKEMARREHRPLTRQVQLLVERALRMAQ